MFAYVPSFVVHGDITVSLRMISPFLQRYKGEVTCAVKVTKFRLRSRGRLWQSAMIVRSFDTFLPPAVT